MKFNSTQPRLLTAGFLALSLAACDAAKNNTADAPGATAPQTQQGDGAGASRPDRIPLVVGGSVVSHKRYPWMAALVSAADDNAASGQFCGASLIAERWVLTAAHCVEEETANSTDVLIGQLDLRENNGTRIGASRILIHPDYQAQGYPDLALIELEASVQAPVITLPSRNNPVPNDGEIATVIGWGQVSETGPYSDQLRETAVPIVDHDTCNQAYNNEIDRDAMVCAGTPSGDKDSCYGDSGGPLFVQRNDSYVQAGVVSFGEECGLPGVPGVYARVSSYYDWISAYAPVNSHDGSIVSTDNTNSAEDQSADSDNSEDNSNDNTVPAPAGGNFWSFNGEAAGWFEEVYLPNDSDSIAIDEGLLVIELLTDSQEPMVVFVDKYDSEYDEWVTLTGEVSRDGEALLELEVNAGEYGFSVLSLGDGGRFTLNAQLEQ